MLKQLIKWLLGVVIMIVSLNTVAQSSSLPEGFVYLSEADPTIKQEVRYAGSNNFIGRPLPGYEADTIILTRKAAAALHLVQTEANKHGLSLLVYDGYRPQDTVDYFYTWAHDLNDQKNKNIYYPHVNKRDFFKLNYIALRSGHTRGSTVDLTLIDKTGNPLDMGTIFDYMDPLSHPANRDVTPQQFKNRHLLREWMYKNGFEGIDTEWWHFTLIDEPYPDTYFNFPIR